MVRVIEEVLGSGGSQFAMGGGGGVESSESMALPEGEGGGQAAIGGGGCTSEMNRYVATRFGYAANGRTVTFVHHECPPLPAEPVLGDDAPALVASSVLGPDGFCVHECDGFQPENDCTIAYGITRIAMGLAISQGQWHDTLPLLPGRDSDRL